MPSYYLFLLAAAPPILLAYAIATFVKLRKIDTEVCVRLFLFGGLIGVPVISAEEALEPIISGLTESRLIYQILGVALVEEGFKYLVVRLNFPKQERIVAPVEAIVLVVMTGLGFALAENVAYVFAHSSPQDSLTVAVARMFTAVPAHALFAIFMGYFIGRAQLEKDDRAGFVAAGLASAILLHGIYNRLVDNQPNDVFLFLIITGFVAFGLIREGRTNSREVQDEDAAAKEPYPGVFLAVKEEVEAGFEDEKLKAMAYANSLGEEETKRKYIRLRAEALMEEIPPLEAAEQELKKDIRRVEGNLGAAKFWRFIALLAAIGLWLNTAAASPLPVAGIGGLFFSAMFVYQISNVVSIKKALEIKEKKYILLNAKIMKLTDTTPELVQVDRSEQSQEEVNSPEIIESDSPRQVIAGEPDNQFYEQALAELDSEDRDPGIWAKAYAEADDDLGSRKLYIKLRVEALRIQNTNERILEEESAAEADRNELLKSMREAKSEADRLLLLARTGYAFSAFSLFFGIYFGSIMILIVSAVSAYLGYSKSKDRDRVLIEAKYCSRRLTEIKSS